eukprot:scaffold14724_cov31-Phaeocystis_antarctica.AAC.1
MRGPRGPSGPSSALEPSGLPCAGARVPQAVGGQLCRCQGDESEHAVGPKTTFFPSRWGVLRAVM